MNNNFINNIQITIVKSLEKSKSEKNAYYIDFENTNLIQNKAINELTKLNKILKKGKQ